MGNPGMLALASLVVVALFSYAGAACWDHNFECMNGRCTGTSAFCNGYDNCGDNSDEAFCDVDPSFECPSNWTLCPNKHRCIPSIWMCNGKMHCSVESEEPFCFPERPWKRLLLQTRKSALRSDRWGSEVHRIAVALHLADDSTFKTGNSTGEEIRNELTIELLRRLSFQISKVSSQELALHVQALLVSCLDPRDFYGRDLVRELRKRVEGTGNYTDPFLVLVLCNAGDAMTPRDVERVTASYGSRHRPSWTDSQALSSMALTCLSSRRGLTVDNATLDTMLQGLKSRQATNGTVDNFRTTALVTQALFANDAYKTDFDLDSARKALHYSNTTKSLLNAYYALPVFFRKSLLDVTSGHCRKQRIEDEEIVQKLLDVHGETVSVRFSVWVGEEINRARTWRLKMCFNSSVYDAIETVSKVVNRRRVEYNVVDSKPYVSAWNGTADDPELGTFWFVYLKNGEKHWIVNQSPVDMKLKPDQEIILWYRRGPWNP